MNKMKCFSAALVAFFLSATHLCAQDIEKEFDDFAKQQQQEFEDFKNKADAEFETFLRETWQKYEAFAATGRHQSREISASHQNGGL